MVANCKSFHLVITLVLLAVIHREALATKHVVGGSNGWDQSTDFDTWSSSQTFKVGDQLQFTYSSGMHSVMELASESAYKSCNVGSALKSLNGGSNTVELDKAGTRYFACGTSGHCEQGMKVKITVVGADAASSSSSSSSPNPSGATTSNPSGATTSACSCKLQFLSFFTFTSLMIMLVVVHVSVW